MSKATIAKELDLITDAVLAYRPPKKDKAAKRREKLRRKRDEKKA